MTKPFKSSDIFLITRNITIPNNTATGENARKVRITVGLSLREVARRMQISAMYLSDLERGKRNWSEQLIQQYQTAVFPPRHTIISAEHPLFKTETGTPDAPPTT